MTSKGVSKIYKHPNADTLYITIPAKVATDSTFPFKPGDKVQIEIVSRVCIIRKKRKG